MDRPRFISECKRRYENGEKIDALLDLLRAAGASKIDSIAVLVAACGVGLGEAKELVHFSSTWDQTRNSDENLHQIIEDTVAAMEPKD